MTEKQVEKYIREDLNSEPIHDCEALANAITEMSQQLVHDENELMWLLLGNVPINSLMTHSYGFHTRNGREIIETIKEKYYEYES
jgi:replication initiation and membrane attachment protein DnaB